MSSEPVSLLLILNWKNNLILKSVYDNAIALSRVFQTSPVTPKKSGIRRTGDGGNRAEKPLPPRSEGEGGETRERAWTEF
jgi:hypothetical protein